MGGDVHCGKTLARLALKPESIGMLDLRRRLNRTNRGGTAAIADKIVHRARKQESAKIAEQFYAAGAAGDDCMLHGRDKVWRELPIVRSKRLAVVNIARWN